MPSRTTQNVTGIAVHNKRFRVPTSKIEQYRKEVLELAQSQSLSKELHLDSLKGKLAFIKNISRAQGLKMQRFAERILNIEL